MLSQKERLNKEQFDEVFTHGHTINTKFFLVKYIFHPNKNTSQFAVVVPKKIITKPVARNKTRRFLYEILRACKTTLPVANWIFIAQTNLLEYSKEELVLDITNPSHSFNKK